MSEKPRAIAFDVDADSLALLREGLPGWKIETVVGTTPDALDRDWSPEAAALLVVGSADAAQVLGLCRGLRGQAGRAHTPLLVLVPPAREALVRAALDAGANSCLVVPFHAKELAGMVSRARAGSQPGRHTLGLDRAQGEDHWQDEGGEG
jgi:DNA-binding response OmpR family regulator